MFDKRLATCPNLSEVVITPFVRGHSVLKCGHVAYAVHAQVCYAIMINSLWMPYVTIHLNIITVSIS